MCQAQKKLRRLTPWAVGVRRIQYPTPYTISNTVKPHTFPMHQNPQAIVYPLPIKLTEIHDNPQQRLFLSLITNWLKLGACRPKLWVKILYFKSIICKSFIYIYKPIKIHLDFILPCACRHCKANLNRNLSSQ